MPTEKNSKRNSKFRDVFAPLGDKPVEFLHKKFPWLTANEVTAASLAGVTITSALVAAFGRESHFNPGALIGFSLSSGLDFLDGKFARLIKKEHPELPDSYVGELVDVTADRLGELFMALTRMTIAASDKNTLGVLAAAVVAITNPLPSLLRAHQETKGLTTLEDGRNIVEFFGGRFGRALLSIPASSFKDAQPVLDLLTFTANIANTWERRQGIAPKEPLTEFEKTAAKERKKLLLYLTGVSAVATLGFVSIYALNRLSKV